MVDPTAFAALQQRLQDMEAQHIAERAADAAAFATMQAQLNAATAAPPAAPPASSSASQHVGVDTRILGKPESFEGHQEKCKALDEPVQRDPRKRRRGGILS